MRSHRLLALAAGIAVMAVPQAHAATVNVSASATVNKPLVITFLQDLDLGTIVTAPGTWSGATVGISRTGNFTCATPNLICSGATQVAKYHVQGSNSATFVISAPNVTLRNSSNPAQTLTLVVDNPGTMRLPNSGTKGSEFSLGGSIAINSTTPSGEYAGTFNVTVDYQ